MSTASIVDGVIYIGELAGYLHCLDAKTGKKFWQFDLKSAVWGSTYYVDGKVFIATEDGDLFVFKHMKDQPSLDEVEIASKEADDKAANAKLREVRKEVSCQDVAQQDRGRRSRPLDADRRQRRVLPDVRALTVRPQEEG